MKRTIRRIWEQGTACIHNRMVVDVSSNLSGRVGRKRVEINFNKVAEVRKSQRTNIRSLSNAIKVSKSTLHRRIKEGALRPHSNPLKPHLSEEIKRARLRFCLSMLEPSTLDTEPIFKSMHDCVHIDEKWFYMTKESEKYYLLLREEEQYRTCKGKRFITKVMFMAAVARPCFDADGNEEFSGKIGIFPFTYKEPAKRNSKNRSAGFDAEFLKAASQEGFDICLLFQPPQSPDMNVLDLGFFRAIQSLQYQEAPTTIDALVHAVEKSFDKYPSEKLNRVFLTLQTCMIEVMKVYGGQSPQSFGKCFCKLLQLESCLIGIVQAM
ncbi:hypothetical protein RHSIM_Rhsim06G0137900 [Rhododendron simsii]|uniref:Transposase n=1 Tax=Rhododendron simsii TaxID=118357 RepID=A0A834GUY8_RHOSS|nr:hypothetical protein RHSIM_Rhsim06G0137900 [Rhododendron simsii]